MGQKDRIRDDGSGTAPLDAFGVMRSGDVESARHAVLNTYGATRFDRIGRAADFAAKANFVKLGPIALSYCEYSGHVEIDFPGARFLRQQFCLGGAGRTRYGSRQIEIDAANWSAMVPAGADVSFDYKPSFRQVIMWLDCDALERAYAAMTGGLNGNLAFNVQGDPNSPAMQALRRAVAFLVDELDVAGNAASPLALAEIQDVVLGRFLLGHQPELIRGEPIKVPQRPRMRRLEEYLRENWNQPLTIEVLAETTGVGARSIFRYFKETRGCTPLDFMKTLRLEQARRALQQPGDGTTVSAEALRCGFNNMGHFAKDYRRKFGELPSETLLKARMR